MRDGSQAWNPYTEDPPQPGLSGLDGEDYHLHSGEDHASYRRTSYDRGDRYTTAMDLPQHIGGGLAPPHPSEYNHPQTPTLTSEGGVK